VVYAIVHALRRRGMDVATVQDRGREHADDGSLLAEAFSESRIMLTNDKDFLAIAAACSARGETFAPIFFWPQQRRRVGDIVRTVIREASINDYASMCSRAYFL
jgi:hypothetical protein